MKTDMYVQMALGEAKQSFGALSSLGLKERRHHLCRSRISLWKGNLEWRLIWGKPWHATRVEKVADFKAYCSLFFSHTHTHMYIYIYRIIYSYLILLVWSGGFKWPWYVPRGWLSSRALHCTNFSLQGQVMMINGLWRVFRRLPFFDPFGQV